MIWSAKCMTYTYNCIQKRVTNIRKIVWMNVCYTSPSTINRRKIITRFNFLIIIIIIVLLIINIKFTLNVCTHLLVYIQLLSGWVANLMLNNHVIFITYLDIWKYADVFSLTTHTFILKSATYEITRYFCTSSSLIAC